VRAVLDVPEPRLRAGLFGRLAIANEDAEPTALVVPAGALARVEGEDVVFAPADEERTFRPVPVRLGRRDGDVVEVLEGLDEGDTIVTSGAFTLRSELSRGELAEHGH
jgi:cobalt-zinc-cadmium efflux system membrane fusion protein